jgi:predicted RNase H-like nuclease (RuvC/YqgF family)
MTKKRLEDLLREEAGKPLDSETKALPETALDQLPTDVTPSEMEPLSGINVEPSPENSTISRPKRSNPTKAELETTVTELQEALQAAYQNESSLQQQVANLQLELQEQKTLVEKLQAVVEQVDQLKAELEEAKAVILQLSETNSRTTQKTIAKEQEIKDSRSRTLSLKKLPRQVTQPNIPSKKLSDRDIGWFD